VKHAEPIPSDLCRILKRNCCNYIALGVRSVLRSFCWGVKGVGQRMKIKLWVSPFCDPCKDPKITKAKVFQRKGGGGGEGDLPKVWIFSLSLEARTMEEIHGK
jgi:hypothetical protein